MIGIQTISVLLEEPGVGLTLLPRATRQLQYYGPVLNEHGITPWYSFFSKKKKRETLKPSRNNIHCQPQARTQEKFFLMLSF